MRVLSSMEEKDEGGVRDRKEGDRGNRRKKTHWPLDLNRLHI